ncbi:MAG: hypothetical protein LBJ64_05870 [Deltaproteobacteria bacterium]|nr:hypothetical protein [Deltaproteobacteria bacterium]
MAKRQQKRRFAELGLKRKKIRWPTRAARQVELLYHKPWLFTSETEPDDLLIRDGLPGLPFEVSFPLWKSAMTHFLGFFRGKTGRNVFWPKRDLPMTALAGTHQLERGRLERGDWNGSNCSKDPDERMNFREPKKSARREEQEEQNYGGCFWFGEVGAMGLKGIIIGSAKGELGAILMLLAEPWRIIRTMAFSRFSGEPSRA